MITRAILFERFAGRDAELKHLVELRARAAQTLRGGTVLISGDAGIGKSRLLTEFEAAPEVKRSAFVRVRCEEVGAAYAPLLWILDELQSRRELRGSPDLQAARDALSEHDAPAAGDAAGRQYLKLQTFSRAIAYAAKRLGGLTIVIDDAHWSDRASLEGMRVLARAAETLPLALVITLRPDEIAEDHARAMAIAGIEREGADRMRLGPLDYGDVVELLRTLVPSASTAVIRRIYELSEGKPYVAEELARSAVERGGDGDFEPTLTLKSAVLERAARLDADARDVIGRASVLGRNFDAADLRALGTTQPLLIAAFRAAVNLQLVEERERDGVPSFRFRHALTREILYRDLLAIERRSLHASIADHLAGMPGRTSELAYHLAAAGETARALAANERAGDEAVAIAAIADAAPCFARALALAGEHYDDVARIAKKYARALEEAGELDELFEAGPREADRLDLAGRPNDALEVRMIVVTALVLTRLEDAIAVNARANEGLTEQTPSELRFALELINARTARVQQRPDLSLEACARAEAALPHPSPRQRAHLLFAQAQTALRLNDLAGARRFLDLRETLSIEGGNDVENNLANQCMAEITYQSGEIRKAIAYSLESAAIWKRLGRTRPALIQLSNAAYYSTDIGDFATFDRILEECRRERAEPGTSLAAARIRAARARGGDYEPFAEWFESEVLSTDTYLIFMLGRDLPWMFSVDRPRARSFAVRALDAMLPGELDPELVETVVEFGSDDDVARGLKLLEALSYRPDHGLIVGAMSLVHARLAYREHRPLEGADHARAAVEFARFSEQWLPLAHALDLLGETVAAREVLQSVGAVAEIDRLDRRAARLRPAAQLDTPKLTMREEQVARLVAAGLSSREAADRLAIGVRTVETHLNNVYLKLDIASRADLAAYFAL